MITTLLLVFLLTTLLPTAQSSCGTPTYGVIQHLDALFQIHMGGLSFQLQNLQASFPDQEGIKKLADYYDHLFGYRSQAPPLFPKMEIDTIGTNTQFNFQKVPVVDPKCVPKKNHYYRSFDGSCNWIKNGNEGTANTAFARARPTYYGDGYNSPRPAPTPQATPRNLSNAFFDPLKKGPVKFWEHSAWLSALVEFIVGDLFGPAPGTDPDDTWDIPIPKGDPNFDPEGTGDKSFKFTRAAKVPGTGVPGVPRQIINTRTPWFDLDPIYGIDPNDNKLLRSGVDGKMRMSADGNFLPLVSDLPGKLSFKMYGRDDKNLFASGDPRANRDAFLMAFITVFVKEHNRLCDVLKKKYPNGLSDGPWTDDLLFLSARTILSIKYSTIAMNYFESYFMEAPSIQYGGMAFNPFIFIQETNEQSQIRVNPNLLYPPDIHWGLGHPTSKQMAENDQHPNVPFIETDVAYRYHDIVPKTVPLVCDDGFPCGEFSVTDASYNASRFKEYGMNNVFRGMATNYLPDFGTGLNSELRNTKFDLGNPSIKNWFDLATWSIERERSNGVPTWNQFFGTDPVTGKNLWPGKSPYDIGPKLNWEDFTDDPQMVNNLKLFYNHPDEVDLAVAQELEKERWPANALPKSVFAANILGLINQGLIDRFSLSIAQSRCLVEMKPWNCTPTTVVEEVLWRYIPEWGIRWFDQFWLDEFDINNDGARALWGVIVKNTDVKCMPLNPLFVESDSNPLTCYNITSFPGPDPREFLIFTTELGQTTAFWNRASLYGDIIYYQFPPAAAGPSPLPITNNLVVSNSEYVKHLVDNPKSSAFDSRPKLPLFEYLYSASLHEQGYGIPLKREYALANNDGPSWKPLRSVVTSKVNPSIAGHLFFIDLIAMNYLKFIKLDPMATGEIADPSIYIRAYQVMVAGQVTYGFPFYINISKGIFDETYITMWMELYMKGMDWNLPSMAWAPSANYTTAQNMLTLSGLAKHVWESDPKDCIKHIPDLVDKWTHGLVKVPEAVVDKMEGLFDFARPAELFYKDAGFTLNETIPVMLDLLGGNIVTSQYIELGLWMLSCKPEIQKKLYNAIHKDWITYDFLNSEKAHYLLRFVKELTRWLPLATGVMIRSNNDVAYLDGRIIQKEAYNMASLFINGYKIARDPKNFKNPDEFDPDRWVVEPGAHGLEGLVYNHVNYTSLEFGVGAKKCPAALFGFVEVAYAIGELVQRYEFSAATEAGCAKEPIPFLSPFASWFKPGDLSVRMTKRGWLFEKDLLKHGHSMVEKAKKAVGGLFKRFHQGHGACPHAHGGSGMPEASGVGCPHAH